MRAERLALIALLAVSVAAGGCKTKKEEASSDESTDKDKKASKKKGKEGDDEEAKDDEDGKKKKKKKDGDDDSKDDGDGKKKKKGGGALTGNFEGQEVVFKYGRTSAFGSLRVELSNEKLPCKGGNPSDDAYTLSFELSAGPDGKFFTGYPIGVPVSFNHQRIKLKSSYVGPQFVNLKVDSFELKEGEHLKGSLSVDHKYVEQKGDDKKDWKYTIDGNFDVEICDAWSGFKSVKMPISADAPEGDVAGKFAGEAFSAKTILATVSKDYSGGKKEYISQLEFYSVDGVDCKNSWTVGKKSAYFYLGDIGGTGESTKFEGTKQPAQPWFASTKNKSGTSLSLKSFGYNGGRRAWVKFDKLSYKDGSTITGSLLAESPTDAKPEDTGKIGGTFTAKVCNSGW